MEMNTNPTAEQLDLMKKLAKTLTSFHPIILKGENGLSVTITPPKDEVFPSRRKKEILRDCEGRLIAG